MRFLGRQNALKFVFGLNSIMGETVWYFDIAADCKRKHETWRDVCWTDSFATYDAI